MDKFIQRLGKAIFIMHFANEVILADVKSDVHHEIRKHINDITTGD